MLEAQTTQNSLKGQAAAFFEEIGRAQSVLIGTHLNPDGDALGSALALSLRLDEMGKPNEVICNDLAPYNLRFLPGVDRVRKEPTSASHDLGIVLDLDSLARLGSTRPYFERLGRLVVIDHHIPQESPGDLRIVDAAAPATALLLARLLLAGGAAVSPDIATCLLTGIVTDTGSFRYRTTTPESLEVASRLLGFKGNLVQVGEEVYQGKTLESVSLLGRMILRMHADLDNQMAWATLRAEDFRETGAKEENTEGLVNEMLAIHTVQIAALIRESEVGKVRASIRSRGRWDVEGIARQFGGGGHRNAAGCTLSMDILEAERLLVAAIRRCLESS